MAQGQFAGQREMPQRAPSPLPAAPQANPDMIARRSPLPKQQSVTGQAMVPFGSQMVIVHNKGPIAPRLGYDGRFIDYPVGSFVPVPAEIAWFHWGVIAFGDTFERPKDEGSYFRDRLSSYCPLFLWQKNPEEYEAWLDWFDSGVEFKVNRPKTLVESVEWDGIESPVIQ